MFQAPISNEEAYLASVSMLLTRYPVETIERLIDPGGGIALAHDYPPTLKQIADFIEGPRVHKWSDGTLRREREWVCSTSAYHGPNFTRERLAEEAALWAQGLEPAGVTYRGPERVEHPRSDRSDSTPWAWWRKPETPSRAINAEKLTPDELARAEAKAAAFIANMQNERR